MWYSYLPKQKENLYVVDSGDSQSLNAQHPQIDESKEPAFKSPIDCFPESKRGGGHASYP